MTASNAASNLHAAARDIERRGVSPMGAAWSRWGGPPYLQVQLRELIRLAAELGAEIEIRPHADSPASTHAIVHPAGVEVHAVRWPGIDP